MDSHDVGQTGEWRLLKTEERGSTSRLSSLEGQKQGTLVLWNSMDRIVGRARKDDTQAQSRFLALARSGGRHLAMVFHRYLRWDDGEPARASISTAARPIRWCARGTLSVPRMWPRTSFPRRRSSSSCTHPRTEYVLPHKDRMTEDEHEAAAGPGGWNAHQGFYVYRERRLLVAGGWLNLGYATRSTTSSPG